MLQSRQEWKASNPVLPYVCVCVCVCVRWYVYVLYFDVLEKRYHYLVISK